MGPCKDCGRMDCICDKGKQPDIEDEIAFLKHCVAWLNSVNLDTRRRVLRYLDSRYWA